MKLYPFFASSKGYSQSESTGILLILSSTLLFSLMSLLVRMLKNDFRADSIIFYRSWIQAMCLIPWMYATWKKEGISFQKLKFHLIRGSLGILSMFCLYKTLSFLPLGLATLLTMTSVFWAGIFSRIFLREAWMRKQILMGGLICFGVMLSLYPSDHSSSVTWQISWLGVVFGLITGFSMGMTQTYLRYLRQSYSATEIVFYFGVCGMLITLPGQFFNLEYPKSSSVFLMLGGLSFFATIGQFLMTVGFRYAQTLTASLCQFQGTVFNLGLGFLFLQETPPSLFFVGAIFVLIGIWGLLGKWWR